MPEYRINLDIYHGPLDLLLYLIRREEVDIYDIPLAKITEQYIQYVEMLKQLDPNMAGEFLVMAATLMEIKTRMLLPAAPVEEGEEEGIRIDPRAELVRQLLEYKAFKDAAVDLSQAAKLRAMKFSRTAAPPQASEEPQLDLEDIQVWDLLDALDSLMAAIGQADRLQEVIHDDTPIELHAADIVDRLQRESTLTFEQVFAGRTNRDEIVGLFLALLELVRRRLVLAGQDVNFARIYIRLNPNPPEDDEADKESQNLAEEPNRDSDAETAQGATESDTRTEAQGTGP